MGSDPKPLRLFLEETQGQSRETFLDSFHHPFLLIQTLGGKTPGSDSDSDLEVTSRLRGVRRDTVEFPVEGSTPPPGMREVERVRVAPLVSSSGEPRVSIGRTQENDLQLVHSFISKKHAVIERDGSGRYRISDLGSTNGTAVNFRPVQKGETRGLSEADTIILGGAFSCTFLFPEGLYSYITSMRSKTQGFEE